MSTTASSEDEFSDRLDTGLWLKLLHRAWGMKRYFIPLVLVAVMVAVCDASFAQITRWTINGVEREGRHAPFLLYAAGYFAAVFALCLGVWAFIHVAGNLSHRLAHDIRRDGFDKLQSLEFGFYDTRPVGWLITRLTSDCDRLARIIAWGCLDIVWGISFVVMIAVSLLLMNWRLGLIVLGVVPPLALVSKFFQRRILLSARVVRKFNSQITASFNESIQGVRTTKTLVREPESLAEFQVLSGRLYDASVLNARQSALYYPIVATLGSLAAGLSLWRGGYLAHAHRLELGTLVAFINFAGQFFNPINQLALRLTEMQGAQAAGERVMGLLATEPAIRDSEPVIARVAAAGAPVPGLAPDGRPSRIESIEFREVSFRYGSGPAVLADFNLHVGAGQTIALVGASGGGKSTIASLVCRFYEPVSGQILFNGIDYRERPLQWLQSQFGIVLQTPHLFKGSVRENIRYGRLNATDAEIATAAKRVNAHGFIEALEQGYDTPVGEGGNRLSTGQRQLLSFARALVADPQIFVMDEATSSIDTETEQLIQAGLQQVMAGRICFVIAHRLSTVRRADRILVIDSGTIVESGRHQELLTRRGRYHDYYTSQFRRDASATFLAKDAGR